MGLIPVFGPFGPFHVRGISTLNFGPFSTKLGGTVGAIKKMTQNDNGPGPGRNYGETAIFTFGLKAFFGHTTPNRIRPVCSPPESTLGSIFRHFVSELRPFL